MERETGVGERNRDWRKRKRDKDFLYVTYLQYDYARLRFTYIYTVRGALLAL